MRGLRWKTGRRLAVSVGVFGVALFMGGGSALGASDTTPPTVTAPTVKYVVSSTVWTTTLAKVSWTATDSGSGVCSNVLQESRAGAAFTNVVLASATATSASVSLSPDGSTYQFRVMSTDCSGNASSWQLGPAFQVAPTQENGSAIGYSGGWSRDWLEGSWGGQVEHVTTAGASATFQFTGSELAFVSTRGPDRGAVKIKVDAGTASTIDLVASTLQPARIVYVKSFSGTASHTVTLTVVGTSGRPRVDVDGFLVSAQPSSGQQIRFLQSTLAGTSSTNITALQFGPDGRLYVANQNGLIKAYTIQRTSATSYSVTATQTIYSVNKIPNHNDDGTLNTGVTGRQVTGMVVAGTSSQPVLYVSSSDPRIGGGTTGNTGLDTNSGVISRLTETSGKWTKLDLVRGLPRSEENHSTNGLALDTATNTLYVAQGGNTNLGAPSNYFAYLPEYALSAAILSVNLTAIGNTTYDLPTLNDPRSGGNANDPFGGDFGNNQAIIAPGGPVQVYSSGWRNPYDVIITSAGKMYAIDNGSNGGEGEVPAGNGPGGTCTNASNEPGFTDTDRLLQVTAGLYAGHPNPTRGNLANTFAGQSPVPSADPQECQYLDASQVHAPATFPGSTDGMAEYTASAFSGAMQGDILAVGFERSINAVYREQFNADGSVSNTLLFSKVFPTGNPLAIATQGDSGQYPGTVWVGDQAHGKIAVFEPN
jgi:hypothetical protein